MATLTGYKRDNAGVYIDKDPEAVLDYTLDWVEYLPSGGELSTATWSIDSISGDTDPLTIDTSAVVSVSKTTAVISGGTAGNIYTVRCLVTTTDDTTDRRSFRISVKNRAL